MTDMKNRVMGSENKWEKKRKERNEWMKVITVERKKEREGRVFLLKEVFRECVGMWSQPYGPRMPFDGIGLKQSNGLVNPIERFEVARCNTLLLIT